MLQEQVVQVDFTNGVSKKVPDELVISSKLMTLDEALFDVNGNLNVRGGYTRQALTAMSGSATPAAPNRVVSWKGAVLLEDLTAGMFRVHTLGTQSLRMDPALAGADVSDMRTAYRGSVSQAWAGGAMSSGSTGNMTDFQFALGNGYRYYAWMETYVRYRVETPDGGVILEGALIDLAGTKTYSLPRLVFNDTTDIAFLYYVELSAGVNSLKVRAIPQTTFALGTETAVATLAAANPLYDVHFGLVQAASWVVSNGDLYQNILDGTDGATATYARSFTPASSVVALAVHSASIVAWARSYTIYWSDGGGSALVKAAYIENGSAAGAGPSTIATGQGTGAVLNRLTLADDGAALYVVYDNVASGAYPSETSTTDADAVQLRAVVLDKDLATSQTGNLCGGFALQGRMLISGGRYLLPVVFRSPTTPCFFLIDVAWHLTVRASQGAWVPPAVAARLAWGEAHHAQTAGGPLPQMFVPAADRVECVFSRWSPTLDVVAGTNQTARRLVRADLDFHDATLNSVEAQDLLYLAGACPLVYDGSLVTEEGFNTPPVIRSISADGPATGVMVAGTYSFIAVYEWVDRQGNLWQSPPSAPSSVVVSDTGSVFVTVSHLRSTMKPGVRVVVYRTTANGAVYYRDLDVANSTATSTTASTEFGTTTTDTALEASGNTLLYTTGGRLENTPMPPCRNLAIHQRRIWASGGADNFEFWYSHAFEPKFAPSFSDALRYSIPADWGRLVGTAPLDDKLALFGETIVGAIFGEGPTTAGTMNGYSSPTPVLQSAGTKWGAPNAISASDDGVWFQTQTGLRLLGRGLALAETEAGAVGADVDALVTTAVTAVLQPVDEQHIYFCTTTYMLVYDTYFKQWSRLTLDCARGATLAYTPGATTTKMWFTEGTYLHYGFSGTTDPGAVAVTANATGAWFRFAGVQGFQRVREMGLLATGTVSVYFATDYSSSWSAVHTLALGSTLANGRFPCPVQKCESMRIKVTGFSTIRSLALRAGVKRGMVKVASTRYA